MTEAKASRLQRLKERQAQLAAQIAAAEQAERKAARTLDTRRKILLGAALLAELDTAPGLRPVVAEILNRRLIHARDRAAVADLLPAAPAAEGEPPGAA